MLLNDVWAGVKALVVVNAEVCDGVVEGVVAAAGVAGAVTAA